MSARLYTRFAGGSVAVDTSDLQGSPIVTLTLPSPRADLRPDEARRLAATVIEQAGRRAHNPPEADT